MGTQDDAAEDLEAHAEGDTPAEASADLQEAIQGPSDTTRAEPTGAEIEGATTAEETYAREASALYAEDYEGELAVLPEVTATTAEVKVEDLDVGDVEENSRKRSTN